MKANEIEPKLITNIYENNKREFKSKGHNKNYA